MNTDDYYFLLTIMSYGFYSISKDPVMWFITLVLALFGLFLLLIKFKKKKKK